MQFRVKFAPASADLSKMLMHEFLMRYFLLKHVLKCGSNSEIFSVLGSEQLDDDGTLKSSTTYSFM